MEMKNGESTNYGPSRKLPQYIAALSVCMGSVAAGMVLGWTSTISEDLAEGSLNDLIITDENFAWIGSLVTLGALFVCFPIGKICDWIGRKLAMLLLIIPFSVGWLLIIFASSPGMIYAGRFITGVAGGAFCVSAPMYTSEIAEKEIRGALGSYFQLLLTVGILLAYTFGYVLNTLPYTIICGCMPLVFGVAFIFQPETPVYLMKRGKEAEAKASMRKLRGPEYNVDAEIQEIKDTLAEETKNQIPFLESLKKRATKKAAIITFGLMFFQQLSGINAVIFYTGDIFRDANTGIDSRIASIIVGVCQVVSTFVSSIVVDKLGRRVLLLFSDSLMALSIIVLGIYFSLKDRHLIDEETATSLGWLPIIALCVFIVVFSLGYGPIPWMISSEVFPSEIKSLASSAAGTFNWLLAFIVTKFFKSLNDAMKSDGTFYLFGAISILGTIFVYFCVPETKGKSLAQIQRELNGEKDLSEREGIDNKAFS